MTRAMAERRAAGIRVPLGHGRGMVRPLVGRFSHPGTTRATVLGAYRRSEGRVRTAPDPGAPLVSARRGRTIEPAPTYRSGVAEVQLQLHDAVVVDRQHLERVRRVDRVVGELDVDRAGHRDDPARQRRRDRDLDRLRDAVEGQVAGRGRGDRLPLGRQAAEIDRLGELERRVRELARLDALARELAVAHRVVALEVGEVRGDLDRGDLRALEGERALDVRGAADGRVAADPGELLLDAIADERLAVVG